MSNKIVEYKDLIAFHPGQYVGELIEDYNVTQKEFADRLGVSMQTWLNLQNAFDVKMAEFLE
jgi:hypothetical protein|nr:hypothetical protein [Streptococcus oralis]